MKYRQPFDVEFQCLINDDSTKMCTQIFCLHIYYWQSANDTPVKKLTESYNCSFWNVYLFSSLGIAVGKDTDFWLPRLE